MNIMYSLHYIELSILLLPTWDFGIKIEFKNI